MPGQSFKYALQHSAGSQIENKKEEKDFINPFVTWWDRVRNSSNQNYLNYGCSLIIFNASQLIIIYMGKFLKQHVSQK